MITITDEATGEVKYKARTDDGGTAMRRAQKAGAVVPGKMFCIEEWDHSEWFIDHEGVRHFYWCELKAGAA